MDLRCDLPFRHPSTSPTESGYYVRDWRGTRVQPTSHRALSVDKFEPLPPNDEYAPGFWYVEDGGAWNDASVERLPWRELALDEFSVLAQMGVR